MALDSRQTQNCSSVCIAQHIFLDLYLIITKFYLKFNINYHLYMKLLTLNERLTQALPNQPILITSSFPQGPYEACDYIIAFLLPCLICQTSLNMIISSDFQFYPSQECRNNIYRFVMIFKFLPLEANLISRLFIQDYTSQTEIPLVLFYGKKLQGTITLAESPA